MAQGYHPAWFTSTVRDGIVAKTSAAKRLAGLPTSFVALLRVQGFSEALEILGLYVNDSAARAIYIRYEKERDGKSDRQNG